MSEKAPVLYWYQTVRNPKAPGGAELVPHLIDNHSGVGSDVLAVDLNNDGAMDIVTATRFGMFIFWGKATLRQSTGKARERAALTPVLAPGREVSTVRSARCNKLPVFSNG
jgi:hypothetical protein